MRAKKSRFPLDYGRAGRNPTYPWGAIRNEFVTGALSKKEIVEKYGMVANYLGRKITEGRWVDEKIEFQREVAERGLVQAKIDVSKRLEASIKAIYNIKLKVLKALSDRVSSAAYEPTVRDLDLLQKLELELIGAGKKTPDTVQVNVTFEARMENLMEKVQKEREQILTSPKEVIDVSGSIVPRGAEPDADFMFGDLDEEEGADGNG